MTFKTDFKKYCNAQKKVNEAHSSILNFFSDFELDYSITYAAGDGVMLLDGNAALSAYLSENDVHDISTAKTKEDIQLVISRLVFDR